VTVEPLDVGGSPAGLFAIVGPLRTGSSLLSRCIDDHPEALCLCESEINRALFPDYSLQYHCWRMVAHGLAVDEAIGLLDGKRQGDIGGLLGWYSEAASRLSRLYGKEGVAMVGDKSPDLFRSPELVRHFSASFPLIYTVRDPRAIFWSIESQGDATWEEKGERWESLARNYIAWKPHLAGANVLVVRYEDLVLDPAATMGKVYSHLGLRRSQRFLMPFPRAHPGRLPLADDGGLGDRDSSGLRPGPGRVLEIRADRGALGAHRFGRGRARIHGTIRIRWARGRDCLGGDCRAAHILRPNGVPRMLELRGLDEGSGGPGPIRGRLGFRQSRSDGCPGRGAFRCSGRGGRSRNP
jgi:hypothetical protein